MDPGYSHTQIIPQTVFPRPIMAACRKGCSPTDLFFMLNMTHRQGYNEDTQRSFLTLVGEFCIQAAKCSFPLFYLHNTYMSLTLRGSRMIIHSLTYTIHISFFKHLHESYVWYIHHLSLYLEKAKLS